MPERPDLRSLNRSIELATGTEKMQRRMRRYTSCRFSPLVTSPAPADLLRRQVSHTMSSRVCLKLVFLGRLCPPRNVDVQLAELALTERPVHVEYFETVELQIADMALTCCFQWLTMYPFSFRARVRAQRRIDHRQAQTGSLTGLDWGCPVLRPWRRQTAPSSGPRTRAQPAADAALR
jgi:hypothetical protein